MKLQRIFAGALALFLLIAPITAQAQTFDSIQEAIIYACIYNETVDVDQFNQTSQQVDALFTELYYGGQLPWYIDSYYEYYDPNTSQILQFEPTQMDSEQYDRASYEQAVAEILNRCILPGMTPVQQALAIHDWLIVNCIYDETLEKNTGYDLLVNGTTVCAGYAAAYQDLLIRLGIPCLVVASDPMDHCWNLVQLDGQWYHVDVTWDDPSPDHYGYVSHEFFLRTDQEISAGDDPHYDWDTDITCTDTRFSDAYWLDITAQICFTDSDTAYLLRTRDWVNYIYARNNDGTETLIYTEKEAFVDVGQGEYCYEHGSLSFWNGRLYYNTQDALISMTPTGEDLKTEYTHSTSVSGYYLYSAYMFEDMAYMVFADHDGESISTAVALESTDFHVHNYQRTTQPATCTVDGYTLSTCDCGLSAKSDPTTTDHSYTRTNEKKATFFNDGWADLACADCGLEVHEQYPKIDPVAWLQDYAYVLLACVAMICAVFSHLSRKRKQR